MDGTSLVDGAILTRARESGESPWGKGRDVKGGEAVGAPWTRLAPFGEPNSNAKVIIGSNQKITKEGY